MGISLSSLCVGVIVQSTTESITGPYLYSHTRHMDEGWKDPLEVKDVEYETFLNKFTKIPVVGILGGLVRIALSILHTFNFDKLIDRKSIKILNLNSQYIYA